ncbi:MAG: hypothetical protein AABY94_08030 [Nitrospirota bacterium]|jgi:hypothetical protein
MKSMLMAVMAVAVAVSFSAPSFADDTKKPKPADEKKGGKVVQMINADDKGGDQSGNKKKDK